MFEVDMKALNPVGEFGSRAWCEACAAYGVQILQAADLPNDLSWAFSETYTHPADRLVSDEWPVSGYHFMVENGKVSGGASIPEHCLATEGFHAKFSWAFLCNQSRTLYGFEGQKQRSAEEAELIEQMAEYLGFKPELGGITSMVWPKPIVVALSEGVEDGAGLHNIAATLQSPSPEFEGMPVMEMGVPDLNRMTDEQKRFFLELCGIEVDVK